jgi:protoporphyrinogen oxidase
MPTHHAGHADRPHANGEQPKVVIIGAGPTGLGAAYRLKELGYTNFKLFDRHPYIGGLAHSFTDDQGFTWDIGGHVMFSHYTYYDKCFDTLMGNEFTLNNRESWVRMFDTWVPYPFQNNIRYLPAQAAYECMSGLIKAQSGRGKVASPAIARNFGEFIDAVFGEGIAKYFMRPYNFKVWAHPPEMMNKHWIGERVAVLDIDRALKNVMLGTDDFGWGPNNQFKFPLKGGTGEFYARFDRVLGYEAVVSSESRVAGQNQTRNSQPATRDSSGHIVLNERVVRIDVDEKKVYFASGRIERYDVLISAMPLDVLYRDILAGDVPSGLRETAQELKHSSGYMVGIGLKSRTPGGGTPDTKSWMYFPEENCPFYRVTYLSNYSPNMTPDKDNYYSLLCEVSESAFKTTPGNEGKNNDAVIEDCITGLENAGLLEKGERANIVSRWCYYADYSYPTPSVDRDEILSKVIPWLEERDIYSRGRFGMWKYEVANTDHTLMQGVELVNRLLLGEPETTIGMVYSVTNDGRNAAEHERSVHAGSGEKKLAGAAKSTAGSNGTGDLTIVVKAKALPSSVRVGDVEEADVAEEELGVTRPRI